jgi:hypothetical protein
VNTIDKIANENGRMNTVLTVRWQMEMGEMSMGEDG